MKKKHYQEIIYQQTKQITALQKENRYLREKFFEAKDFLMTAITGIISGKVK